MQKPFRSGEKRSAQGKKIRLSLDNEVMRLRMLYSSLYRARKQNMPNESVQALSIACNRAAADVQKLGLPQQRIEAIKRQVS